MVKLPPFITMLVLLQQKTGAAAGHKVQLRPGQTAQFGRSEWADFCVADDAAMAETHFALVCTPERCLVRSFENAQTLVNGKPEVQVELATGDEIRAGETTWSVTIHGVPDRPADAEAAATSEQAPDELVELCKGYSLGDAAVSLAKPAEKLDSLISACVARGEHRAAITLKAHQLGKKEAIAWACEFLKAEGVVSGLDDEQQTAFAAAQTWLADSSEENRREAGRQAEAAGLGGAGGQLAQAAFWAQGSMLPPEVPETPADDKMPIKMAALALYTRLLEVPPESAAGTLDRMLQQTK